MNEYKMKSMLLWVQSFAYLFKSEFHHKQYA